MSGKGDVVILTIMILLILFIFTTSMLFMFTAWQKSAAKLLAGKNAHRFAKTGMEEAIWEIDNDNLEEDSFLDSWRANFQGEDVDLNEDGNPDAKWFYVKNKVGEITGRYAVLVEDESSKININYAGKIEKHPTYTVKDIDILPGLIEKASANGIVTYRQKRKYAEPSDVKLVKGIGESVYDRIKNYITCFSYDLNRNRKDIQRIDINAASFDTINTLLNTLGYSKDISCQVALNIIAYREKKPPLPSMNLDRKDMIGIWKTPYINEIDAVKPWQTNTLASGTVIISEQGGQFIEIFNPYDSKLDIGGWKIKGVVTLLSDAWTDVLKTSQQILDDVTEGETEVDPEKIKISLDKLIPTSITIPEGEHIPPHSYYTIGDMISLKIVIIPGDPPIIFPLFVSIKDPSNCNYYQPILAVNPASLNFIAGLLSFIPFLANLRFDFTISLFDRQGNPIEKAYYTADLPETTVQKNDPRMNDLTDWFMGPPTPGQQNIYFQPWIGGEFGKTDWIFNWPAHFNIRKNQYLSLGELSFIHKKQHWKTLDFWKEGVDRKLIDEFTTFDPPTSQTFGRLNINTSSETVLTCLPMVDIDIARNIISARPYHDISEVLGKWGSENSPAELLNREITKYGFDLIDNDRDGYVDTEKEKESVFYDIVNLITVRSNVFKIISLGQKVQNIENDGKIVEKILAEKKVVVWYDRRRKKVIYRREIQ